MLTMQEVIQNLQNFWLAQGCVLGQPYNTEVGAGTLNPATSLRVLGPEKWNVAYVEPSVRPDDSRYGLNPNRLQTHTQYQVILKPTPNNPQEIYLQSLTSIGIDLSKHDVRFVEDNWASPALGAWGLGWEVWLDGLEITQFTYFQQSGTHTLDPVPVEITYGLERIVMALQNVQHFKDIEYAPGIKYGDFLLQSEFEMSSFYIDTADVDTQRKMFELFEAEGRRQLDAGFAVPAHYQLLKMSHTFNVLDARGAIGTAERAHAFTRMRDLARDVSSVWIESTAERGHPLGIAPAIEPAKVTEPSYTLNKPQTLALEVGVEELPPLEVSRSIETLSAAVEKAVKDARLSYGAVNAYASPRRLIVVIENVAAKQEELNETELGPKVAQAFDGDTPGPAALGFARKHNVEVNDLLKIENNGDMYIGVQKFNAGSDACEVLANALPNAISQLNAAKNMRWGAPDLEFSRPIRTILALHGEHVIPFVYSDLASGRVTRVHRGDPVSPERVIKNANELLSGLRAVGIEPDAAERLKLITEKTNELISSFGGVVDFNAPVLQEVVNLVEEPTVILGEFEARYLELPEEILISVMIKHQRYFPVHDKSGKLTNHFIVVANGHIDQDAVRHGNQNVIAARYADAAFFWDQDLKTSLEELSSRLDLITFQESLGSVRDHVKRSANIANAIAKILELNSDENKTVERASELLKFDVGSQMATEMTSLSGYMAREYSVRAGETNEVATALFEAETGKANAENISKPGAILAISERADMLIGLFATGAKPTGSRDPFGLRRAAGAIAEILISETAPNVSISDLLKEAAAGQPIEVSQDHIDQVDEFIKKRLEQILFDRGYQKESVRAVMSLADRPSAAIAQLNQLEELLPSENFALAFGSFKRISNLVPYGTKISKFDTTIFELPAETALATAYEEVSSISIDTLDDFVKIFTGLSDSINNYLDDVIVNADDVKIKNNRIALLGNVRSLADDLIDWNALSYEPVAR